MLRYLLFVIVIAGFSSCEKNISIQSPGSEPVLVVEATIENDKYPVVILTKSLDYFGRIDPQILSTSFVSNAIVKISNGTTTQQLLEYTVTATPGYNVKFYAIDLNNLPLAFKGEINKNYTLSISAEGKTYTATTRIPIITRRIDSLFYQNIPGNTTDTSWKQVMIRAYDKPGLGDYIRYYTKRNSEDFLPGDPSVFDDAFIDGTSYELLVARGKDRNNPSNDGDFNSYFKRGDTVTMKISQIDKSTYDFWRTMEYTYQTVGNPFASPIKVINNIQGDKALGYFGGYASQQKSLIIPR
jgi:Domain of unknown function (DUF4249)